MIQNCGKIRIKVVHDVIADFPTADQFLAVLAALDYVNEVTMTFAPRAIFTLVGTFGYLRLAIGAAFPSSFRTRH